MSDEFDHRLTVERFESGTVDLERFDHEAHVYVAWLYIGKFEPGEAIRRFSTALKRLTAGVGAPQKYHATITWLFLLLIAERARENESWLPFRARNHDLIDEPAKTLDRYYSKTLLSSSRARQHFVLPDRLAS